MTENNNLLTVDKDLIYCPLSLNIMRYPVLASDGYHYELAVLLESITRLGPISPMTKEPLTGFCMDLHLKNTLDHNFKNDSSRYDEYDKQAVLKTLSAYFNPSLKWKSSVGKSILTGGVVGCATLLLILESNSHQADDRNENAWNTTLSFQFAFASAAIDYLIRSASGHRFGLFGGLFKALSYAEHALRPNFLRLLDEEEERLHHII
ncbi:U-box domain-containing protein [Aquicella lusitana]|uniref:U-box domain-containing protein n=1 Tax=Aquicella lusitana TaxID=254246 RepID=A0A370GXY3_9COXI|nr:U-box domain-containing protein [Aquicella lusitana]RDI48110.1 U-box domain-containing protein [Aquicella lusitana]VVC72874.1 hypothetical protein AQULUS_05980 [Aquicella lusitana]